MERHKTMEIEVDGVDIEIQRPPVHQAIAFTRKVEADQRDGKGMSLEMGLEAITLCVDGIDDIDSAYVMATLPGGTELATSCLTMLMGKLESIEDTLDPTEQ